MGKIITTNNSNNNNMKNDGDLKCKIKENFNNIINYLGKHLVIISAVISLFYAFIDFLINIKYKFDCENFFGIPGRYFSTSANNKITYLAFIIIIMIVSFGYPMLADKYMSKHSDEVNNEFKIQVIFIKIMLGTFLGILCLWNLISIMEQVYKLDNYFLNIVIDIIIEHSSVVFPLFCVIGIIAVIGYNSRGYRKPMKLVFYIAFIIVITIMCLAMYVGMQYSISDKTAYEFVTIDNNEYVVLSHYDNQIVVVPYETKKDGSVIFYTSDYYFYDEYKGIFKYIELDHTPVIDKSQ